MNDTCMICGADIPEGGQVCRNCQKEYEIKWGDSIMEKVYQKGFKDGQKELLATGTISFINVRINEKSIDEAVQKSIDKAEINGVPLKQYASERSEGHWTVSFESLICSVCGKSHYIESENGVIDTSKYRYCPSCGARMMEEAK